MKITKIIICSLLSVLLLLACGCTAADEGEKTAVNSSTAEDTTNNGDDLDVPLTKEENVDGVILSPEGGKESLRDDAPTLDYVGDAGCEDKDFAEDAVIGEAPGMPDIEEEPDGSYNGNHQIGAGTLTAGEIKDNDGFDEWLSINWAEAEGRWKLMTANRVCVSLNSQYGSVFGAPVHLMDKDGNKMYSAVTDKQGKAYLFYGLDTAQGPLPAKVVTKYGGEVLEQSFTAGTSDYSFTVESNGEVIRKLDLMFVVDTTGSMGDELEYLKAEIEDVISRTVSQTGYDVRTSVNFYRDEGDEYVVKYFAFENDVEKVKANISAQYATGGGDYPEAVHTALYNAVNEHAWDADSVKVMFLLLDAPPHEDKEIIEQINITVADAAAKGIRIIPVASSGIDKTTEYILRSMALLTGGTYTFLTDTSGIGGTHLPPSASDYTEEKLNDLMVRILNEYCDIVEACISERPNGQTDVTVTDIYFTTNLFPDAHEEFYTADGVTYIFPCIQSSAMVVVYSDGTEEPFMQSLEAGRVVISDLDRFGIGYFTETDGQTNTPATDDVTVTDIYFTTYSFDSAYEEFYTADGVTYLFGNIQSHAMVVVYSDGTEEPFVQALEAGRVTISDLDRLDIYYFTETETKQ